MNNSKDFKDLKRDAERIRKDPFHDLENRRKKMDQDFEKMDQDFEKTKKTYIILGVISAIVQISIVVFILYLAYKLVFGIIS